MSTLKDINIEKGWTAFYDLDTKKVFGITEFKNGGKAKTALSLITKPTKAEVLEEIATLGLSYTPPVS